MPIGIELRDADGGLLGTTGENPPWSHLKLPEGDKSFPMLGWIDPYGDTYFSRRQMELFRPELSRLMDQTTKPRDLKVLREVDELAERCQREPHTFLVFVGD